jgi:hypothetical protein
MVVHFLQVGYYLSTVLVTLYSMKNITSEIQDRLDGYAEPSSQNAFD